MTGCNQYILKSTSNHYVIKLDIKICSVEQKATIFFMALAAKTHGHKDIGW